MQDTVGKVRMNPEATFYYRPLHTDGQVLDDQLELTDTGYSLEDPPEVMDD